MDETDDTVRIEPDHLQRTFSVNGEDLSVSFASYKTLLEVLREDLGLTGTKHGCELGECGACAVLLDGIPVLSCLSLGLEAAGSGEGEGGEPHRSTPVRG